jgi:transposase
MTRPYSNDLRERVVSAVEAGETCRAVSARFGVSVSTVVKWSQRYRRTGSVVPGQMGGHRAHGFWSRIGLSSWAGSAGSRT